MTIQQWRSDLQRLDDQFAAQVEILEMSLSARIDIFGYASEALSEFDPGRKYYGINPVALAEKHGWKIYSGRLAYSFFPGNTPNHVMNALGPVKKQKLKNNTEE